MTLDEARPPVMDGNAAARARGWVEPTAKAGTGRHADGRHRSDHTPHPDCAADDQRFRCRCTPTVRSSARGGQCCARMDAEDMLCADCRRWCSSPPPPAFPGTGEVR